MIGVESTSVSIYLFVFTAPWSCVNYFSVAAKSVQFGFAEHSAVSFNRGKTSGRILRTNDARSNS